MPAPADIQPGATPHDMPCPWCKHTVHHFMPCADDGTCDCTHAEQLGIDTALGG